MSIDDARRRLLAIRDAIDDAIQAIDSGLPSPPGEALEKMDQGICLKCGKKIKRDQQARRYCHESCYRTLMRRIQEGETTEDQLINDGILGPKITAGRPRKPSRKDPE